MKSFTSVSLQNKRVLHIINSLQTGGAESTLAHFVIEAKDKFKSAMDVAVYWNSHFYYELLVSKGIKIFNFNVERKYNLGAIWKTIFLIKHNKYDIVFAQLFPACLYVALASVFFTKVTFLIRATTTNTRRQRYWFLRLLDRFIYSRYKKIVCVDKSVERELIKWVKQAEGKTIIVNKGIPLQREAGSNIKKFDLIFVGRLVQAKGIDILLHAISKLRDSHLIKRAAIVGHGPLMSSLMKKAKDLDVEDVVNFMGEQNDVTRLLSQSSLFVLPSRWEGTPSSLLEAMAAGVPVIATNVGNMSNIIRHGSDGLLISSNNADELAQAIKMVLTNPALARKLSQNARRKIMRDFSITNYTKNLLNLIVSV